MIKTIKYIFRDFKKVILHKVTEVVYSVKFIFPKHLNKTTVFFLRKTRTFIKSKYSRTRQFSKVIVYFGLWYGITSIWFMMLHTYKFIFVLSYIWWVPALFSLFILFRFFKKNLFFVRFVNFFYYAIEIEFIYLTWLNSYKSGTY